MLNEQRALKSFQSKSVPEKAPRRTERRRQGIVRHDNRGNGYIEWVPAPPGHVRPVFSIAEEPEGSDPYNVSSRRDRR